MIETTIKMNKNLLYARYSRKSSESKEKQALSIMDQNLECDKVELRDNLQVVCKLEESKSAFKPNNRPEFDKMVSLIESGHINGIITWKPDRLCRNPREGGILLQLLQDKILQEIRCATGEIYTPDSDHLILQIHFGMANQYSRNLSQNVIRGLTHKCERGEYPRPAPLGYEGQGERGQRNIQPHPFESLILKEVFELASIGNYSLGYLIKYAEKKGLKTKTGKHLGKSHLYNVLTSPTYYGQFYQDSILYNGNYEPIISKTLWDMVQKALKNRSKPKINTWNNDWNGLAYCGVCGCSITISNKVKHFKRTDRTVKYSYAHCTHRRGGCTQTPISIKEFERMVLEAVSKITIDKEAWTLGIELLKEKHKHETNTNLNQLKNYEVEYHTYQEKLNKLVDMRADGELTKEEFMDQKNAVIKEISGVESRINDTKLSARSWLELTEEYLNNSFNAKDVMQEGTAEEKRKLILSVGENLILKDKKLQFSFKKPYDVLLLPKYRTNVLSVYRKTRTSFCRSSG
jgi:DNA invertase Pin-like site-specific DNA recombinase